MRMQIQEVRDAIKVSVKIATGISAKEEMISKEEKRISVAKDELDKLVSTSNSQMERILKIELRAARSTAGVKHGTQLANELNEHLRSINHTVLDFITSRNKIDNSLKELQGVTEDLKLAKKDFWDLGSRVESAIDQVPEKKFERLLESQLKLNLLEASKKNPGAAPLAAHLLGIKSGDMAKEFERISKECNEALSAIVKEIAEAAKSKIIKQ